VYIWFWWENLSGRDHMEDPDLDGRIILRTDLQEVGCEGKDWIDVAQDKERWWAFLNVVLNLWVL
jgi:hypothetical protein